MSAFLLQCRSDLLVAEDGNQHLARRRLDQYWAMPRRLWAGNPDAWAGSYGTSSTRRAQRAGSWTTSRETHVPLFRWKRYAERLFKFIQCDRMTERQLHITARTTTLTYVRAGSSIIMTLMLSRGIRSGTIPGRILLSCRSGHFEIVNVAVSTIADAKTPIPSPWNISTGSWKLPSSCCTFGAVST